MRSMSTKRLVYRWARAEELFLSPNYFAALTAAQRAFCAAAIFRFVAALNPFRFWAYLRATGATTLDVALLE
jgi:hypothetical protein